MRTIVAGALAAVLALAAAGSVLAAEPDFVAFHLPWDPHSQTSLARHIGQIDIAAPLWVTLRGPNAEVVVEPDPKGAALLASRKGRPEVYPIVSNAHDDVWDSASAQAAILDPATRDAFLGRLARLARARGFGGYIFDLENLTPATLAGYPAFLAAAKTAFASTGVKVWSTAAPGSDWPLPALAEAGDAVVLMAYDACWATSTPGPVAGQDWLEAVLAQRLNGVDSKKVVIALGSYGYDWPEGGAGSPIGADAAIRLADRTGAKIIRDPVSRDPHFSYTGPDGRRHQVWYVDGRAFALARGAAASLQPRAIALWRLGLEDPDLWTASPVRNARPAPSTGALPHPCDPLRR